MLNVGKNSCAWGGVSGVSVVQHRDTVVTFTRTIDALKQEGSDRIHPGPRGPA